MATADKSDGKKHAFAFYTQQEYWQELLQHIHATKPGGRILLMSMTFEPTEPEIAAIMHEVELAASRGVTVNLAIDAHSFLLQPSHIPGPLWSRGELPKRMNAYYRNKLAIFDRIRSFPSGSAEIINLPNKNFALPIAGRSHIKAALINDQIFLGGCNLEHAKKVDLMVGWKDAFVSDWLYDLLQGIIKRKHAGRSLSWVDRSFALSDTATIHVDSGLKGQSVIFDEALQLIDSAEEWLVLTCQFFPNSITAKHLALAARRGVKIEVIYTHPKHHGIIGGFGQQISILRERTRVPRALFKDALSRKDPLLHAKLIACDKGFMVGSHNYVNAGVFLGTAEIALKCTNQQMAREAVKTLHRGLGKNIKTE